MSASTSSPAPPLSAFPEPPANSQPPTTTTPTTNNNTSNSNSRAMPLPLLTDLNPDNLRVADLPDAIVEEDEDSASEAMEPLTPTSDAAPRGLHLAVPDHHHFVVAAPATNLAKPIPLARPSTTSGMATPQTAPPSRASPTRPSPLRTASRSLKSLFRRHPAQDGSKEASDPQTITTKQAKAVPPPIPTNGFSAMLKNSLSISPRNSPTVSVSQATTPPSPGSPASTVNGDGFQLSTSSPTEDSFLRKQPRSSTGLSLRVRDRVKFGATPHPQRLEHRIRSPSLGDVRNQPERPGFSIPAEVGVGLKARRMSSSLPDDFTVDTCELTEEFVSPSRVPGRRGRECGRGATATVRIMCRKGASRDIQYAVKEFRKRSQKEDQTEYEKKVKSEFSIANSLHHPNIVETVRLCTHNGRWNHVMEYCVYGELFSLVQKHYLQPKDNMCFFKQVVRGIAYLHDNGIAHRDIKLENLLLSEEGHVKITDFGVSEVFSGIHPGLRSAKGKCGQDMGEVRLCAPGICGSLPYIAPEVLAKKESYDPRPLDVWSCAIVYLTLHFKGNPWQAADVKHTNYKQFETGWKKYLERFPDGLVLDDRAPSCGPMFRALNNSSMRRLLLRMLHPDPKKRITIKDVLADRHYKSIECCAPDLLKDPSKAVTSIDAGSKGSCRMANKMLVQKIHNHFPPEKRFMPPHRFETGEE